MLEAEAKDLGQERKCSQTIFFSGNRKKKDHLQKNFC